MSRIGKGLGAATLVAALWISAVTVSSVAAASTSKTPLTVPSQVRPGEAMAIPQSSMPKGSVESVCGSADADHFRCLALRRTDVAARPASAVSPASTPAGFGPSDLVSAYNLPRGSAGSGLTVAVVDAYDSPNAEADLAIYRAQFGLPACTTANGCFRKVDQYGGASYPTYNAGWASEIALDLDMVSAICPNCNILLVEATDSYTSSLGASVNAAVSLGAAAVSNSYGHAEGPNDAAYLDTFYNHPGVAITVSTGDCGFSCAPLGDSLYRAVQYPAASQYVTAVGGTSLFSDSSNPRGWTETAWGNVDEELGAGSGCSEFQPKPSWQTDSCRGRMTADVSAVADPDTGVAVYTTDDGGWRVYGGTSASAPIIAGVYALAGKPAAGTYPASYLYSGSTWYSGSSYLYDVVGGSNNVWESYFPCIADYWCTGLAGYDGPTGLGTPDRIQAFSQNHAGVPGKPVITASSGDSSVALMWTRPPDVGATITGYTVTSSPASSGCVTTTERFCTVSGLSNWVTYRFWVVASSSVGPGLLSDPSNPVRPIPPGAGSTFVPLSPARILDTRDGTGIGAALSSHVATGFAVWGRGGVPVGAVAVTGNLTVTQQTSLGFMYVGPAPANNPPSSTLNLYVTYAAPTLGATAHAVFDVTGYFVGGTAGATYHTLNPTRLLDSRAGTGLSGPFVSHVPRNFRATGSVVPVGAVAVTGNLTVTQQTSLGFLYIGPSAWLYPTSSTLNFPLGDDRANAVTVQLGSGGSLSITYAAPANGQTAHVIFDVTGYFTADTTGALYVPLTPNRVLDTREGRGSGILRSHSSQSFQVIGQGGVPGTARAVTGNLTVTQQASLGFLYVGPQAADYPTSSTLNFPLKDDRANSVTVALNQYGQLYVTYAAPELSPTSHAIFDVTGYFTS
jgi:hypothetical protein